VFAPGLSEEGSVAHLQNRSQLGMPGLKTQKLIAAASGGVQKKEPSVRETVASGCADSRELIGIKKSGALAVEIDGHVADRPIAELPREECSP